MPRLDFKSAAQLPGAPGLKMLYKYSKSPTPPAFVVREGKHWRVDTDSPAWGEYLSRRQTLAIPGEGAAASPPPTAGQETYGQARARRESYLADMTEIKLNAAKKKFVEVEKMRYYMSFFSRAFHDELSQIRKLNPVLENLYKTGQGMEAQKRLMEGIQKTFLNVINALNREIEAELGE